MKLTVLALAATLASLTVLSASAQGKCGRQCRFRLCKEDGLDSLAPVGRRIQLRDPGIALPPFICRKDLNLGTVLEAGEARVAPRKGRRKFTRISRYNPPGLSEPFSRSYFDIYGIFYPPVESFKRGIGREGNSGNQDDFAGDLCVILPIKKYTVINKKGKAKTVRGKGKRDCVSFTTTTTKLLIELTWVNPDDLDLVLEEPDGTIISKDDLRSSSGGALNGNNNANGCKTLDVGKEQVNYKKDTTPLSGTYKVTLIHRGNCKKGPTPWGLYIISEGSLIGGWTGESNLDNGQTIGTFEFTF